MSIKNKIVTSLNPVAKALVPERLYFWLWSRNKPDRRYMEGTLLPAFAKMNPAHFLMVGTRNYCAHYGKYFDHGKTEYWTTDIEPDAAEFGAPGRHIIASITDADQHFKPDYFDIVSFNGIFGWGVNETSDQIKTLINLRKIMHTGGVLLIGWNNDITKDEVVAMATANGFKYANPLGLPNRKEFGGTHVYDLFTAA